MLLLRIYLAGLAILISAIAMNVVASIVGLATWYQVLTFAVEVGAGATIQDLRVTDLLFLLLIYPGLLGAVAYAVLHIF